MQHVYEVKTKNKLAVQGFEAGSKIRVAALGAVFGQEDPEGNTVIKACVDFTTRLRAGKS